MNALPFVPADFEPPQGLATSEFTLEPLGPQHNEADFAAWTSSLDQISTTPGFVGRSWPHEMTLRENLDDLEMHQRDFAERRGFTYTVLDIDSGDVIGCVYIYPVGSRDADTIGDSAQHDASVRSWVTSERASLDRPLWAAVSEWLHATWPFEHIAYAPRL